MNKTIAPISTDQAITSERLIMKDNSLIMASYSLTVDEQRLILASIEKAQRQGKTQNIQAVAISINVKEYAELYKVKMGTAYKALKASSDKLYERSIKMNDAGVIRRVRWLQEQAIYDSGKVELVFSAIISKHIRDIVTKQSTYRLEQATQLSSQHAIRLFEIFQMVIDPNTQEGSWDVSVIRLKELLEIENYYDRWIDLKKKVILSSLDQINRNTSLKADWEVTGKEGKRITDIRFHIFESSQLSLTLEG